MHPFIYIASGPGVGPGSGFAGVCASALRLYICSPSGPSWPAQGWILLYLLHEYSSSLRDAVRRKGAPPPLQNNPRNNSWFLLQENAPAHRSDLVKDLLSKNNATSLEQPPYSSDLVAANFYPFPQMKLELRGRRFCDTTDIIKNATDDPNRLNNMTSRSVTNAYTVVSRSV
jgi:transposase